MVTFRIVMELRLVKLNAQQNVIRSVNQKLPALFAQEKEFFQMRQIVKDSSFA